VKTRECQNPADRAGVRSTTMRLRIALDLRHNVSSALQLLIHIAMPSSEANYQDNSS